MKEPSFRTSPCTRQDAKARLRHAEKYLEVADLVSEDSSDGAYSSVAAALAVLSGIASADAACCGVLGRRSRSVNHHDAERLLAEISPGGPDAATALRRLISLKDTAHYGLTDVSGKNLETTVKQARRVLDFATAQLLR
jgi:hypothetical protein